MKKQLIIRQAGFYSSDLTYTVLSTIAILISLIMTILFAFSLVDRIGESSLKSELSSYSNEIIVQMDANFKSINDSVNQVVNKHIPNYDNTNPSQFIQRLKQDLPTTLRTIITIKEFKNIVPESFPGINYATLDMLKTTKKTNKNPIAEIHLFGQEDQYLNYVFILANELNHYLIISFSTDTLLKNLANFKLPKGNIKLIQKAGKYSVVNLRSWGAPIASNEGITNTQNIKGSHFHVKYSYKSPFYVLRGMSILSSAIGVFSALLLFIALLLLTYKKIKLAKQKAKDEKVYVHVPEGSGAKNIEETIANHEGEIQKNGETQEMEIEKSIFRAYDIRGIVDEGLTANAVKLIGQAIGTENINRGKKEIVIARDGRTSGPRLLEALTEGLIKSGCNVINIGAVPTGVLYFATHHLGTGSGVMLTGSHNPPNYNGLKIMLNGDTLAGKSIMDLYKSIVNGGLEEGEGSEQEMDIVDDYIDYISSDIQLENELKVVVDSGNGIGGEIGPQLLEEIGCEVIPLYCDVDGSFPNHHPDPSVPENLQDLILTVKESDADIGIAFDGDADRLGVVTKQGEIIYPDRLLMLFAQDVLTRQPGASIIFDVKCTGHLPKEIVKNGGLPIIWKTGHSFIKEKIKETNAALAGEMSGHFFFNERWFGFDDGIYAAARLLEIIDQEDRPAEEIFAELPNSVSTPELKCHTAEGENYAFMEKFKQVADFPDANITTIDGIRADFANGWGLIRCSNTTPCLVLRFDADTEETLETIKEEFRTQILAVDDSLKLPF